MKTTCVCVCSRYMADTRAQLHSRYDSRPLSWYHVETCELQNVFVFFLFFFYSFTIKFNLFTMIPSRCEAIEVSSSNDDYDERERIFLWIYLWDFFLLFVVFLCDRNFLIIINFSSSSFNCEKKDYDDDEEFVCKKYWEIRRLK